MGSCLSHSVVPLVTRHPLQSLDIAFKDQDGRPDYSAI